MNKNCLARLFVGLGASCEWDPDGVDFYVNVENAVLISENARAAIRDIAAASHADVQIAVSVEITADAIATLGFSEGGYESDGEFTYTRFEGLDLDAFFAVNDKLLSLGDRVR